MSAEANKRVVQIFMESLSAGDVDAAMDCFAEDSVWQTINWTRPGIQSKEEKRSSFTNILSTFPKRDFRIWPTAMIAEGDKVAAEAESSGTPLPGKNYTNRYHFLFRLRDGKIVEAKEYCDTAYTAAFWEGLR